MARRNTTSRLAKRRGKTMARKSMLTIILSIGGLLLFLFVLVPQLVQLFFRFFGGGELNLTREDIVPPQVPIINSLPEATAESLVTLEGFGEPASQVAIVLNGEELDKVVVDEQGSWSYSLGLEEGENLIVAYGIDEAENESNTKEIKIILDTELPALTFEDLENGKEIAGRSNQNLSIRGETEPNSDLTLNDKNVYVKSDGTFSTSYYLNDGENTLKFIVTDQAGNQAEREVKVNFRL